MLLGYLPWRPTAYGSKTKPTRARSEENTVWSYSVGIISTKQSGGHIMAHQSLTLEFKMGNAHDSEFPVCHLINA
jgi:hypothetical protein